MNKVTVSYIKLALRIILIIALVILGFFLSIKLIVFLAPFFIAFLISNLVEPLMKLFVNKLKMNRKIAALITVLLALCTLGSIIFFIVSNIISQAESLSRNFNIYRVIIYENAVKLLNKLGQTFGFVPGDFIEAVKNYFANIFSPANKGDLQLAQSFTKYLPDIVGFFTSIPQAFIFTIVTILSTFFLISDRYIIAKVLRSFIPESWSVRIHTIYNDMFSALLGYLKAQGIIMSITFTELTIGLGIIGVNYYVLIAAIIALIDILPVLGTGGIVIPWAIISFINGDTRMGVSLFILYGVVLVVRQLIEPKIVGHQIGMHPLLTLLAMYSGLKLFGVVGLIFGPITILMVKNILSGIFKNYSLKDALNNIRKDNTEN